MYMLKRQVWRHRNRAQNRNIMPGILGQGPTAPPNVTSGPPKRNRQWFAIDTLDALNVPITQNNINALLAQMEAEEPPGTNAGNNPANIEVGTAQSHGDKGLLGGWNLAPQIAVFDTWKNGVWNYANELRKIAPNAVADLANNVSATQTVNDLAASGWGTSASLMESIVSSGSGNPDAAIEGKGPVGGAANLPGGNTRGGIQGAISGAENSIASALSSALGTFLKWGSRIFVIVLGVLLLALAILVALKG